MDNPHYIKAKQYSTIEIKKTRKGFFLEYDSHIQGSLCGVKLHIPYSEKYPKDLDLNANSDFDLAYSDKGDELCHESLRGVINHRILSWGQPS
jgi:hypothetical protein